MDKRGLYIAFEGLDGSGISTHSRLLGERLHIMGKRVHLTKEPSDGPVGFLIRQILKGDISRERVPKLPHIMSLLFAADRLIHFTSEQYGSPDRSLMGQSGLSKALAEGYYVVSDRSILSSLAYQSVPVGNVNVDYEWMTTINKFASEPDLIIFLDTPVEVCLRRVAVERWKFEIFENYPDMELTYKRFIELIEIWKAQNKNIIVVKGVDNNKIERPVEEVQTEIRDAVEKIIMEIGV